MSFFDFFRHLWNKKQLWDKGLALFPFHGPDFSLISYKVGIATDSYGIITSREGRGSQVIKFEQVSSDHHQMVVAGGKGVGPRSDVGGEVW